MRRIFGAPAAAAGSGEDHQGEPAPSESGHSGEDHDDTTTPTSATAARKGWFSAASNMLVNAAPHLPGSRTGGVGPQDTARDDHGRAPASRSVTSGLSELSTSTSTGSLRLGGSYGAGGSNDARRDPRALSPVDTRTLAYTTARADREALRLELMSGESQFAVQACAILSPDKLQAVKQVRPFCRCPLPASVPRCTSLLTLVLPV